MRRRLCLLLALATTLAAHGTCAAEDLAIGFANPLSGPYATSGNDNRTAVELAVEVLDRTGGLLGRRVRVVVADDACGVERAEAAARELVGAGVVAVVGHFCSHASLVAAAVYEAAGVPMISPDSTHPRLTEEGRGDVFRLTGRDDRQGGIAGDFLAERWPAGRIAVLHDGSTYGKGLAAQARRRLRERGVKEAVYDVYTPGEEDRSALVARLEQAGVEVAYVAGYGPDAARIVRAARERGDGLRVIGGDGLGMDEFWAVAGPAGEGTVFTGRPGAAPDAAVAAAFRARGFGWPPPSVGAYAAVQVWARAVREAGTADPAAVTRALHRGRFGTVLGRVAFDGKGDLEGADWRWWVWTDGRREPLTAPLATRSP
jgi:branched-chain amino acid transport system substrate-binding protein